MNDHGDAMEGTAQLALVKEEQLLPQRVAHLRDLVSEPAACFHRSGSARWSVRV